MVLISKYEINLKEAHEYAWIVYSDQDHLFQIYKKRSQKIIVVNSITTILKLVKKGVGIAIIPEHTLDQTGIKSYEIKGMPKEFIYLTSLNFSHHPEHIKRLVDLIKKKERSKR
jgi:DNA-binding transcriptional LysR family regulator